MYYSCQFSRVNLVTNTPPVLLLSFFSSQSASIFSITFFLNCVNQLFLLSIVLNWSHWSPPSLGYKIKALFVIDGKQYWIFSWSWLWPLLTFLYWFSYKKHFQICFLFILLLAFVKERDTFSPNLFCLVPKAPIFLNSRCYHSCHTKLKLV
jgi:hypothetical protein